ncbi:GGDEF domain-containing protein [Marinobacter sp. HL-58]|uniref:GGDEF domain-containing protein n=1 Tax=Marinobacter sp. HL-58 TaxID=1479237 RepID=UPI000480FBE2|nr:GGDEF domain-containing protein [Marinobacter sp. HL-58]KPQ01735.1 MAG: diguanylate cyclase (GGDEF) domain [Marinobacter sp. HL-58]
MKHIPTINKSGPQPQKLAALRQAHREWSDSPDVLTRITRRLSTSLSLETQLAILAEEINTVVPFDCMNYRHQIATRDFVYATGMGGPHRCDYRLNLEGSFYGTLSFSRRQKFAEQELEGIELMLAAAICPIRNACQFIAIEQAALTDSLTGVPNKRALDGALARACSLGDRHGEGCSLILCDLDQFKAVNDEHGHVVGDHILKLAAAELEKAVRNSDSVYRFGGEEFAILLPHTDENDARSVADRIREYIRSIVVNCGDTDVSITTSCGVAQRLPDETPDQWLARADEALYRAKDSGRNCTRVFAAIRN